MVAHPSPCWPSCPPVPTHKSLIFISKSMLASWPCPPHSYCPYNQGDLSAPLDLPHSPASLVDNPGHVQSSATSLCSGLFQMPPDIFFLLFIINKTLSLTISWSSHFSDSFTEPLTHPPSWKSLSLNVVSYSKCARKMAGLWFESRAFNLGSMMSRDFLPPVTTLGSVYVHLFS